jgi:hypothetical protein
VWFSWLGNTFPVLILLRIAALVLILLRTAVFSGMTCNMVEVYHYFRGTYYLLQGERVRWASTQTSKTYPKDGDSKFLSDYISITSYMIALPRKPQILLILHLKLR